LEVKQTKARKNRQQEADVRKAANKHYSESQRARKANKEQQERLDTVMFGTKEERAKKLMDMAQCLQKMGEEEKERTESHENTSAKNGTGEVEEDEVGGDRMDIEEILPIKRG